jgi:hypothetical protein
VAGSRACARVYIFSIVQTPVHMRRRLYVGARIRVRNQKEKRMSPIMPGSQIALACEHRVENLVMFAGVIVVCMLISYAIGWFRR